uniref:Chromatin modification-related protein MEAF6 n=1 Tax=Globisporangium ultimum (strain ATCC 200006 / CBS 805.95 / DAOM BR144) TaxID=431595 RepID=K3X286_GLOUD
METQVSEGMRALFEGQKKLHESILKMQQQIEEEEAAYLEETPHGNIIRGWDGFIDSKQPRKDAATKKIKPYTDAEHLFSSCCFYASLGQEPTIDLVDPAIATEEAPSRRKLSTASVATGGASGSAAGTPSANGTSASGSGSKLSSLQRSSSVSERKGSFLGSSGKGGKGGTSVSKESANAATTGKASKLKKRKREKLDDAEDTGEDGKAATKAATADSADDDFVDDF